ncbi:fibronectin type III domain-containing protein [Spirosoma foliorum]|uniref:Fibronectin type III domain-containing protein n=1 Tax=Spirosoma foliorum TaxID=2710596 RepID=A0A7G5GZ09_9BACT|nr:fibronectin type III domain-containing protein [Spirosoma foliorum]QMW04101.1 fibronectin type III domain-containing protein [Spirosoma foliorum]
MPKTIYLILVYCLFRTFLCPIARAQTTAPSTAPFCGIENITLEKAQSLVKEAEQARQKKIASGNAFQSVTYVPIRPHIIRQSNGSGGFSLANLNKVMAMTNSYYLSNGLGIQFYFAGSSPDYIDNDDMYNSYNYQSVDAYDARNAMNQYYVNQFAQSGLGGFAYYPDNAIYSTRSFILNEYWNIDDMGNRLIPHELGHSFNLIHTFDNNNGTGNSTELVTRGAGANCTSDGDLICDTPADPYGMPGAYLTYYNGCPQYDPNSTARDANGYSFSPSVTNIMSYYFPCTHDFTPGQYDRMQAALALRQSHTAYTLDAPPTNVTAPSNLSASLNGTSIVLTWRDNSSNEMGYFIERSTSASSGFVPIGGVAPDVTTFTDDKTVPYTQYYYRIRPSNSTTGSLSPVIPFLTDPSVTGLYSSTLSVNAVQLNWNSLGTGITYIVQYRPTGTIDWYTLSGVSTNYYQLYNLQVNTTYEWQVKATGASTYSGPLTFSIPCPVPSLYTTYPTRTSTSLSWLYAFPETYTLQWRVQNTLTWNTIEAVTSSYYSLTGLTASTAYEWRVQGTCPGSTTVTTDYSSPQSFTTQACPIPALRLYSTSSTSVSVYWYTSFYESGRTFSLRYRPVGTTDWTTLNGLTVQEYSYYSINGLTTNTTYEAQVESVCSPTDHSGFSPSLNFTPSCQAVTYTYSSANYSTASLQWSTNYQPEPGTTFDLQYRLLGTTDWSTINSIPVTPSYWTTTYSLTGLTPNTTYEWRVRTICPTNTQATHTIGNNFTTSCLAPNYGYWGSLSSSSVSLFWNASSEPTSRFDIRYRPIGAADWITLSNLTITGSSNVFSYSLTSLSNNTFYEWQVRTVCSATDNSTFINGQSFTTSCRIPENRYANPLSNSAYLGWTSMGFDVTYDVLYRRVGTTTWIPIAGLKSNNITIMGLLPSTSYEWQVSTRCSDGVMSAYSSTNSFTTYACITPYNLSTSNYTPTSAKLSWYNYYTDASSSYEVRYRIVGTTNWTVVSNLNSISLAITNLTPDMQYEWQVRTICSPTSSSDFSYSFLFQTCSAFYTIRAGNWYDNTIWSCNRIPTSTDIVQIKHAVTVPSYYTANALRVGFDPGQQLTFGQYARLQLGQ